MGLAAFIDKSLAIENPEILFSCYLDALAEFGVDRVMYSALRNTPHEEVKVPGISHCYPEDWIGHYMANDYVGQDPVRAHCLGTRHAFSWQYMMQQRDMTATQKLIMNQGNEFGLHDGVAVPFHGPMGEVYGVGMASSEANPDVSRHLKEIQVLSTQFHVLFSALHNQEAPVPTGTLTKRETEVLKWCAVGKSNWAIGEILGISEHGVDFHVRNILRKLDADTRVTAVVKAMHSGLIAL